MHLQIGNRYGILSNAYMTEYRIPRNNNPKMTPFSNRRGIGSTSSEAWFQELPPMPPVQKKKRLQNGEVENVFYTITIRMITCWDRTGCFACWNT
jgi:hypothetical protein